jgi:hypothetical protein
MLQLEQRVKPPLIAQRDLQRHGVVPLLKHQVLQVLELALHQLVQESMVLLRLRGQLVESEPVRQQLVQELQLEQV